MNFAVKVQLLYVKQAALYAPDQTVHIICCLCKIDKCKACRVCLLSIIYFVKEKVMRDSWHCLNDRWRAVLFGRRIIGDWYAYGYARPPIYRFLI